MLSTVMPNQAPYVATLFSDLRQLKTPYTVCVVKSRFIYAFDRQAWIRDNKPPAFQEIDCWTSTETRQVTDLVPEKQTSELLLWGQIRPRSAISLQAGDVASQVVVKVGNLSPEPVLYWQDDWKTRPTGKSAMQHFLVAPSYARYPKSWDQINQLTFYKVFSSMDCVQETVFRTNHYQCMGTLVSRVNQQFISFVCDSIYINTDAVYIDMVWRTRFPWDLMGEDLGELHISMQEKKGA
ncbi:MAG: hypothetical protein RLZ35_712 [Pseudomonadota bacterium]|jgi:hypothetical protein